MTSYDEIIDLALVSIEDYRLNKIAKDSPADFRIIMDGFMIRGLSNFQTECKHDLGDREDSVITLDETGKVSSITPGHFNFKMIDLEKDILADYTVIAWLDKGINDTRQITGMLQNKNEAHRFSEAQNLTAKNNRRIALYEDVAQKKTAYTLYTNSWSDWANGNYGI